jgi:hypothetical protein
MELSPEDIRKDKGKIVPHNFIIYIFFEDFCNTCNPYKTEIADLCDACKNEIGEQTISEWLDVKRILDAHDYPDMEKGRAMLPNVDPALMQECMERQLKFNPYYYRIMTPEEIEQAEREQEIADMQA